MAMSSCTSALGSAQWSHWRPQPQSQSQQGIALQLQHRNGARAVSRQWIPLTQSKNRQPARVSQNCCNGRTRASRNGSGSSSPEPLPLVPKPEQQASSFSRMVVSLSRANNVRSALALYNRILELGQAPTLHASNSLMAALMRQGLHDDAVRVFDSMKNIAEIQLNAQTFSMAAKLLAKSCGWHRALELLNEMQQVQLDTAAYNTLISVCGRARRWKEVHDIWEKLKEQGCRETMVTYSLLVSTFVQCNQVDLALKAYSDMVGNGLQPSGDILKGLVCVCANEGQCSLALDFFHKMVDAGFHCNKVSFNVLIGCLCKDRKLDLAFKFYARMRSAGHSPDVYTVKALLSGLNRSGDFTRTIEIFESFRVSGSTELDAKIYNEALFACQKLALWERALQYVWEMETKAMKPETLSYNLVIRACEAAKQPKVALQVYERMLSVNCKPNVSTYLPLIRSCGRGSLWPELKKVLHEVSNSSFAQDHLICNAVIQTLCLYGKTKWAKCIYRKIQKNGYQPNLKASYLILNCFKKGCPVDPIINKSSIV